MVMTRLDIPKEVTHYDMFIWLTKQFGKSGERWTMVELNYIDFKDSKDALLFSLRWPV